MKNVTDIKNVQEISFIMAQFDIYQKTIKDILLNQDISLEQYQYRYLFFKKQCLLELRKLFFWVKKNSPGAVVPHGIQISNEPLVNPDTNDLPDFFLVSQKLFFLLSQNKQKVSSHLTHKTLANIVQTLGEYARILPKEHMYKDEYPFLQKKMTDFKKLLGFSHLVFGEAICSFLLQPRFYIDMDMKQLNLIGNEIVFLKKIFLSKADNGIPDRLFPFLDNLLVIIDNQRVSLSARKYSVSDLPSASPLAPNIEDSLLQCTTNIPKENVDRPIEKINPKDIDPRTGRFYNDFA